MDFYYYLHRPSHTDIYRISSSSKRRSVSKVRRVKKKKFQIPLRRARIVRRGVCLCRRGLPPRKAALLPAHFSGWNTRGATKAKGRAGRQARSPGVRRGLARSLARSRPRTIESASLTTHTAGERLPEVGQQLADFGQALRILPGAVVEHQATGGDVQGCGIHRVHRRR